MKTRKETLEASRRLVEEKPELYQALADSEALSPEEEAKLAEIDADIATWLSKPLPKSKLEKLTRLTEEFHGYCLEDPCVLCELREHKIEK